MEAVVNNTDAGIYGPNQPFAASEDQTIFSIAGTVSYAPVPEPSTLIIAFLGAVWLQITMGKRQSGSESA